jgi:hypothetical protein
LKDTQEGGLRVTNERLIQALAAAADAFAKTLRDGSQTDGESVPTKGSAASMRHVLREVAAINDDERRGVTRREMAEIARAAGMDPRGLAGYYTGISQLLSKKRGQDARWITKTGRARLATLEAQR